MRILPHTQLVWAQAAQAHDTRSFHTFLIYLFIYLFIFFFYSYANVLRNVTYTADMPIT